MLNETNYKIIKKVEALIKRWTKDNRITFYDEWAKGMFMGDVHEICERFYELGRKEKK